MISDAQSGADLQRQGRRKRWAAKRKNENEPRDAGIRDISDGLANVRKDCVNKPFTEEATSGLILDVSGNLASDLVKIKSTFQTTAAPEQMDDILPRTPMRRRRAREDRGLPPDEELSSLARIYLQLQRKHWPVLVERGVIPEPTDMTLADMVADFKQRHRTGVANSPTSDLGRMGVKHLAGIYARYSCDNSAPTSIADQVAQALKKAREEERYVPWGYVFCDFSVTGLDATRQGYRSYKTILAGKAHSIDTTYIDDFTRASRDEVEWWQLAALSKRCGKRLIGASDGFSLHDPDWDMKLIMYGLLSRLFIKSLRQKVRRGMTGTAGRGGTLGRPPLGFARKPKRDAQGNVLCDSDGNPKTEYCIDPATQPIVYEIFEKYVVKHWTSYKIARDFNTRNVNNWAGWTEAGIRKVLGNPAYVGVFIWNKTRGEYDLETRKRRAVENPRRDWVIHYDPRLLAVPKNWWKAARRRLASRRASRTAITRRGGSAQRTAKTLFHDALICGYCNRPLRLYRSAGPHRDLHCINGPGGNHGCKLSCSKAVRIVEECLLGYIRDALFTEAAIAELVHKANLYLAEMADKPREDVAPQRARMRRAQASIDKLVGLIEATDDGNSIESYDRRVKELQKEVTELRRQIQEAEQRSAPPPAPLDEARVQQYLADLRGVLNLETQASNELLRTLMGQIQIHQRPLAPGRKRGAPWVATFEPNVVALLARLSAINKYPDSITLEYLSTRIWIKPKTATVELGYKHKYVQLAEDEAFMKLLRQGRNAHEISMILCHSYEMVVDAIRFTKAGEQPMPRRPRLKNYPRRKMKCEPHYIANAREVARLKDEEGHTFPVIARKLGISSGTASRAYNHFHAQKLRDAADRGLPIPKARHSHLGYSRIREIQKLAIEGLKLNDIAARVGCSPQTVLRARKGAVICPP